MRHIQHAPDADAQLLSARLSRLRRDVEAVFGSSAPACLDRRPAIAMPTAALPTDNDADSGAELETAVSDQLEDARQWRRILRILCMGRAPSWSRHGALCECPVEPGSILRRRHGRRALGHSARDIEGELTLEPDVACSTRIDTCRQPAAAALR